MAEQITVNVEGLPDGDIRFIRSVVDNLIAMLRGEGERREAAAEIRTFLDRRRDANKDLSDDEVSAIVDEAIAEVRARP